MATNQLAWVLVLVSFLNLVSACDDCLLYPVYLARVPPSTRAETQLNRL